MDKYMKIKRKIILWILALSSVFAINANAESGKITVAKAFYELARQNNTQKIESLLDRGYSLESVDEHGYNPVCLSVIRQDKRTYNILTSYGANKSPRCLNNIPESAYKRFFGKYQTTAIKTSTPKYISDTPYWIGAAVLGTGAVVAAYALRGETDNGDSGGGGGGGGGDDPTKKCTNGEYNVVTKVCNCWDGYGKYGSDDTICYKTIPHCTAQNKDTCSSCENNYHLKDNVCYPPINNCKIQDGGICTECYEGFGVHGGDGTFCYTDIPYCKTQETSFCRECITGYGTHNGDNTQCYKDIEHCMDQLQTACRHCDPGYDTYDNPAADYCYAENPCSAYNHTIPVRNGNIIECVCNENKGYFGEKENCTQAEDGDYKEGDGNREEWNNLNELYCHSHGKYDAVSGLCTCYHGYADVANGCAGCAENYLDFNGRCYQNLNCSLRGEGYIQERDTCICKEGYFSYQNTCTKAVDCPTHQYQIAPGPDPDDACTCKPNFDENCDQCKDGYTYDDVNDVCIQTETKCEEQWMGLACDICPSQYEITTDASGNLHCGNKCAENRAPIEQNADCTLCAEGYEFSALDNNCVVTECTSGVDGYIKDEDGNCVCDTEHGYAMSLLGKCIKKAEDLVGLKDSNINNSEIELTNDGNVDEFRDIYGMKPIVSDDGEGHIEYYDNIYNALSFSGREVGSITITNQNTGGNLIYGMYSPNTIYNAATIITTGTEDATAVGSINITDSNAMSVIYGMNNTSESSIYNAFSYNKGSGTALEPIESIAAGTIEIKKDKESSGSIIGITGGGNILNAYADTEDGIAANVNATGIIKLTHEGKGEVIGIQSPSGTQRINNALAYLDSAISNAFAEGQINVSGYQNVYGIVTSGSVTNSETQFSKYFNKINDFEAIGIINAVSHSDQGTAYGMYVNNGDGVKVDIYNAMGYNSKGTITAKNDKGGSAYGIWSGAMLYEEGGVPYYNNTYNAFRSSAKYGGNNVAAEGTVNIELDDGSNNTQNGVGIYAAGNIFNAYANSGSDTKLEAIGNVIINDRSTTSGMTLKGIESGGATIANAYATGIGQNTETSVIGNINLNILGSKGGSTSGAVAGIYSDAKSQMPAKIYNAALIEDTSNVTGNIAISSNGATYSRMYGIYASKQPATGSIEDDENEGQEKVVYNAYYGNNDETVSDGHVLGKISITTSTGSADDHAEYYGIYVNEGTAYNTYSTNNQADVEGRIEINVAGGENTGTAVGMYGYKSSLYNSGTNAIIDVKTTKNNSYAYGMKGDISYIENDAVINVTAEKSKAFGLYINQGQAINNVNGVINVNGESESYGIYAIAKNEHGVETESAKAINLGTINLSGKAKNVGIYAEGSNVTVENRGIIRIGDTEYTNVCTGTNCDNNVAIQLVNGAQPIQLTNGAHLVNAGSIISTGNLDLAAMGGNVVLTQGGTLSAANSISGDLDISSDVIQDTFTNQTTMENALLAEDVSNVDVHSRSYLYNADIAANSSGIYDIVMNMKDFSEMTDNSSEASYFSKKYAEQKNAKLFNALKSASTASQFAKTKADIMGSSVLPNITEEELKVQRSLDKSMVDNLFKDGGDVKKIVGADAMHMGRDDHNTLTGYDISSQSMYMLYDKKLNNKYRLGTGLSITHTNTDYNNDSTRKNMTVQGYIPLTYTNLKGLKAVTMARLGYADGNYTRRGYNHTYKADTSEITYGLLNEIRYKKQLGYVNLTPFIGLNAMGWYQDNIDEGKDDLALHIASKNIFSLESALGLNIDKEIEFDQDNCLTMALGIGYYHEFANPYQGLSAHHDTTGHYSIKHKIHSRDRGVLSAKVNYDYKDFSIYGQLMQYLEEEYPLEVEGGLKYKF